MTVQDHPLFAICEELLDPILGGSSYAISGDFFQQLLMTYFVKSFAEIHHQDISLVAIEAVTHKIVVEFEELCLTR